MYAPLVSFTVPLSQVTGPDNGGRPVFMFLPAHLTADADLERVTMYALLHLYELVVRKAQAYTVIWLCNNDEDAPSRLSLRWFFSTYRATPYALHEHLHTLCLVHPSMLVRAKLLALSYLPARYKFWERLDYADRLEFLDAHVPVPLIKTVPQHVKDYDKNLDAEMYATTADGGLDGLMGMPRMPGNFASMGMPGSGMPDGAQFGDGARGAQGADASTGGGDGQQSRPIQLPQRNWERD